MTNGALTSLRFPFLPIRLRVRQQDERVDALLDTGFDGHVVVPSDFVAGDQPPNGHLSWTLADGSGVLAPYYVGTVEIGTFGPFPAVITALGDEVLIGCAVASHFSITLDHGSRVIVEP